MNSPPMAPLSAPRMATMTNQAARLGFVAAGPAQHGAEPD